MRKIFILFFMSTILSCTVNGQEKYDWTEVMNAIIQVESEGNAKAYNRNGDCVGILQITRTLVKDCNQYLKLKKSKKRYTFEDRLNVEKSKEMFVLYQERYNPSNNIEKAIRLWNGGCGYTIKGTNDYLKKVVEKMKYNIH